MLWTFRAITKSLARLLVWAPLCVLHALGPDIEPQIAPKDTAIIVWVFVWISAVHYPTSISSESAENTICEPAEAGEKWHGMTSCYTIQSAGGVFSFCEALAFH